MPWLCAVTSEHIPNAVFYVRPMEVGFDSKDKYQHLKITPQNAQIEMKRVFTLSFFHSMITHIVQRNPVHSVVFAWKIYGARRDCYFIDFNSFLSFNECLMTKKLHKSIYSLRCTILRCNIFFSNVIDYQGFSIKR